MAVRIMFNLPIDIADGGTREHALVDHVPAVGDTVLIDGWTYQVSKVLHVVRPACQAFKRAKEPMVYLTDRREPTISEEKYRNELIDEETSAPRRTFID